MLRIVIEDKTFFLPEQLAARHKEFRAVLARHEETTHIHLPRSRLAWPIIQTWLQGYRLKAGYLQQVAARENLPIVDLYEHLAEDAHWYGLPALVDELQALAATTLTSWPPGWPRPDMTRLRVEYEPYLHPVELRGDVAPAAMPTIERGCELAMDLQVLLTLGAAMIARSCGRDISNEAMLRYWSDHLWLRRTADLLLGSAAADWIPIVKSFCSKLYRIFSETRPGDTEHVE